VTNTNHNGDGHQGKEKPLSETESERVSVCSEWYKAFGSRQLDKLMSLFTRRPVVVVGAGNSRHLVPYAGTYEGEHNVRWYYKARFEEKTEVEKKQTEPLDPNRTVRPFCGDIVRPCEIGPWVIYSGNIKDHADLSPYEGQYLHVFRFAPNEPKIASLEMFLAE
jgi:hypothetical protein